MFITTNLLFIFFIQYFINGQIHRPEPKVPHVDPHHYQPSRSSCYDDQGKPQRCVPDFINVAFNLEVEVNFLNFI
jgi:hypothetical protein